MAGPRHERRQTRHHPARHSEVRAKHAAKNDVLSRPAVGHRPRPLASESNALQMAHKVQTVTVAPDESG
ncbi:MAG: hypothetical protein WBX05_00495, partial [Pseudolabrys sp.]